jgi:hypothetical protein
MATNDDQMLDYLLTSVAYQPERDELKRKQAMVDALRQNAMTPQQGQMVSGHYVAPGLGGLVNQFANAYMAKQGQGQVDTASRKLMMDQIAELRKRRLMQANPAMMQVPDAYQPLLDPWNDGRA